MRVLVACEFSGRVRDAFLARGHDAWSCDLLPTEVEGPHIQGDVLQVLDDGWDLMIAHPPCTYLAIANASNWDRYKKEQIAALRFVGTLINAPIEKVAIENPKSILGRKLRVSDQRIQPWMFGHEETKTTNLWLWNLPLLKPTNIVSKRDRNLCPISRSSNVPAYKDRWKIRSRTYLGIAQAMAEQWG